MTTLGLRLLSQEHDLSVLVSSAALRGEADRFARLADAVGAPATCRWAWQSACLPTDGTGRPWAVTVSSGSMLTAAALLVDEGECITLLGTAEGHRGALLARDEQSGRVLGSALASALNSDGRPFRLGPLAAGPALSALLQHLPSDIVVEPVAVPLLVPGRDAEPGAELCKAMRRNLRKARNRLMSDGVTAEVDVLDDGAAIAAVLPLILTIARDRDRANDRTSPLDDPGYRQLWQRRLLHLAEEGVLRLLTLRLDGEVAAYVLAVADPPAVRVLDGRYVDRFARYAPGRLLEADLVERVRRSARTSVVDWMTTIGPESLLARNHVDELVLVRSA